MGGVGPARKPKRGFSAVLPPYPSESGNRSCTEWRVSRGTAHAAEPRRSVDRCRRFGTAVDLRRPNNDAAGARSTRGQKLGTCGTDRSPQNCASCVLASTAIPIRVRALGIECELLPLPSIPELTSKCTKGTLSRRISTLRLTEVLRTPMPIHNFRSSEGQTIARTRRLNALVRRSICKCQAMTGHRGTGSAAEARSDNLLDSWT